MIIRSAAFEDANAIAAIYNWYILNTTITFEMEAISAEEMRQRIGDKLTQYDWLVGEVDGQIAGYAYYGAFRPRAAYRHTVEATIYLSPEFRGRGLGTTLYTTLINSAIKKGFREMLGVIALPNPQSIKLHRNLGFRESGVLKNVGFKFNQYLDVAFWQKTLPEI